MAPVAIKKNMLSHGVPRFCPAQNRRSQVLSQNVMRGGTVCAVPTRQNRRSESLSHGTPLIGGSVRGTHFPQVQNSPSSGHVNQHLPSRRTMTPMATVPRPPDTRPDPSTVVERRGSPSIPSVRCSAKSKKAGGTRCPKWAIRGGTVCREHGGAAPRTKARAEERLAVATAQRSLDATLTRMNLDAPPIQDPAAAMANLAGRLLSGFEGVQSRLNECREAGRVPNEADIAERALWVKELRSLLTDMTRLQVGVQLAQRYAPAAQDGDPGAEQSDPVLVDAPDVSAIVARVLATEHELETERLVRVEQAKAQGQLPAGLSVVQGETEQAS